MFGDIYWINKLYGRRERSKMSCCCYVNAAEGCQIFFLFIWWKKVSGRFFENWWRTWEIIWFCGMLFSYNICSTSRWSVRCDNRIFNSCLGECSLCTFFITQACSSIFSRSFNRWVNVRKSSSNEHSSAIRKFCRIFSKSVPICSSGRFWRKWNRKFNFSCYGWEVRNIIIR